MAQSPKTELLKGLYKNSLEQSAKRRLSLPIGELTARAKDQTPLDALSFFRESELSVIAEIKRASPSKGDLKLKSSNATEQDASRAQLVMPPYAD